MRGPPWRFHFFCSLILGLLGTVLLFWATRGSNTTYVWAACWLISINGTTFGYYGFDKMRARRNASRVPEVVLHGLSAVGGSPAAYLGMRVFRHKTIKGRFRIFFWCIVVMQGLLALWLIKTVWWSS